MLQDGDVSREFLQSVCDSGGNSTYRLLSFPQLKDESELPTYILNHSSKQIGDFISRGDLLHILTIFDGTSFQFDFQVTSNTNYNHFNISVRHNLSHCLLSS
ncbi:hypothetical protein RFS42_001622 [Vibrio vulnificus]|uniref:hypothetical protein n=1 Tax=Vibrio natriegens TaxID=691 RepID=UPI001A33F5CD|nr:hypothetical protein [Vibrio parahaemolyticus]ELA4929894.1 hypothetical protein [Vibrio vulnificus]EKK9973580.1 hypothetical protein [Vibrio parahaemolyticus]WMN92968.1 hypothetical protein NI381_06815 [Vibrio parahaemolyticus]WMO10587.1 hypothetical protein NI377_06815 [Vibrio parahaemolyticus]HAS6362887.1 hypothetical protein [Vibrio vulnificus]